MTEHKTSTPRLHSVRFKDGGATVRVIHAPPKRKNRADLDRLVRETLAFYPSDSCDIGGFAFVVWDAEGASTCVLANYDGRIPSILIPDFVRNRLLAQKIIQWTMDDLKDS